MMMRNFALFVFFFALIASPYPANAADDCPRTLGTNTRFLEPWPEADTWFGSDSLAVPLPQDGIWPTTAAGALIAVKLFWYSREFQAVAEQGFEERARLRFNAQLKRLDPGPDDAKISDPNWAGLGGLGENWTILTGIDFPSPGCWEITGEYLGQSLTFVVEIVENDRWASTRERGGHQSNPVPHGDRVLIHEPNPAVDGQGSGDDPILVRDQVLIHEVNPKVDGPGPDD